LNGKVVHTEQKVLKTGMNTIMINHPATGINLVQQSDGSGAVIVRKVVTPSFFKQ
jgi:phosphopantothenoylcysteine synthetase/decarboxylase